MIDKLKQFWNEHKTHVISGLMVSAIGAIAAVVTGYFRGWWPTTWTCIKRCLAYLIDTTPTWNWLLAVLFVVAFSNIVRWATVLRRKPLEPWRQYTEAKIHNMVWRWRYANTFDSEIIALRSYCPRCICEVDGSRPSLHGDVSFRCPSCGTAYSIFGVGIGNDYKRSVLRIIQQRIETGDWRREVCSDDGSQ